MENKLEYIGKMISKNVQDFEAFVAFGFSEEEAFKMAMTVEEPKREKREKPEALLAFFGC